MYCGKEFSVDGQYQFIQEVKKYCSIMCQNRATVLRAGMKRNSFCEVRWNHWLHRISNADRAYVERLKDVVCEDGWWKEHE